MIFKAIKSVVKNIKQIFEFLRVAGLVEVLRNFKG
jgi:hypothetical protein